MVSPAQDTLDTLFPVPSPPPSSQSPTQLPGVDSESVKALQSVLKDNHVKWHIFFNDRGFHNHAAHHMLAIYALGAPAKVIEAAYQTHVEYQRKAYASPGPINDRNFHEHLGDGNYYDAYLTFFSNVLLEKGIAASFEDYVFTYSKNHDEASGKSPEMLNRFVDGLLHPFIHAGYGAEFNILGIAAEGLAMAAVHGGDSSSLYPASFFKKRGSGEGGLTSRISSLVVSNAPTKPTGTSWGPHTFALLQRIFTDKRFDPKKGTVSEGMYVKTLETHADAIRDYADEWTVDGENDAEVAKKIDELIWMNVVFYAVGGWKKDRDFKADFNLMHLVTSSLFLSSIAAYLKPTSKELLLRSYFSTSVAWWISRGRPKLDIEGFYANTDAYPSPPGPSPKPVEETLPTPSDALALNPNPWLAIIQTTLVHPNEHLCKIQRAFVHYGALYGTGTRIPEFKDCGLPGAEKLDETLFIRAAGLTADALGWMREGQKKKGWSFDGFYDEFE